MTSITKTLLSTAIALTFISPVFAADVPEGVELAKKQELVRGNGAEVPTLDPGMTSDASSSRVIADMFDGLVTEGAEGQVVPNLATSWDISEDGKTYTFHLREGIKWSNGEPITANDFVYSWQRVIDPATASPYSWYLTMSGIVNVPDISDGKKDKSTLGVKAIDDQTLQISLSYPVPYLVKMFMHESTFPVNQATVEKFGSKWTRADNIVTSGAYTLNKWIVNERIVLDRSATYWNNDKTVINKVTYIPIQDASAEYNRYQTGEIDITDSIPLEQFKKIKKSTPDELLTIPTLGTYYYLFNVHKKPFDDARVRQALAYTLDRDVITKIILGQGQIPAYSTTPAAVDGFKVPKLAWGTMTQKERDAKAKALLKSAGFDSDNPLSFTLSYNTSEGNKKLAVASAAMWRQALGAKVSLENEEWKTYLQSLADKNYDVARYTWIGDYNEPSTFLSYYESTGLNYGGWSNDAYDTAMSTAKKALDEDSRMKAYQDAETILAEQMPSIPVYFYTNSLMKKPYIGGFTVKSASMNRYTRDMYIEKH